MVVIGDYIYTGGGGFWASTRLLEFKKGENKATRILPDLKGEFISGVCQTGEREIMIATCGRSESTKSYFIFVNLDTWEIVKEKQVSADISAESSILRALLLREIMFISVPEKPASAVFHSRHGKWRKIS